MTFHRKVTKKVDVYGHDKNAEQVITIVNLFEKNQSSAISRSSNSLYSHIRASYSAQLIYLTSL